MASTTVRRSAPFTLAMVAAVSCVALGCGGRQALSVDGGPDTGGDPGPLIPTRDVDILFMIDNSSSVSPPPNALLANFPRFMNVLEALPDGLPNLHIAVVSSDMGAGNRIMNCDGEGDSGRFQYTPKSPCTDTTLADGATFIAVDGSQANYSGMLGDVFSCLANLGTSGCGLESPLASIARALGADGRPAPPENQGFLRPDAHLAIIILSDEDDCSAKLGASSPLFDASQNNLAGPLGPVSSFRCNEFGHVCNQGTPNRNAPNGLVTDVVDYTNCRSNENSPYLTPVASFAAAIRGLKRHPDERITVSSIVGVPQGNPNGPIPYRVEWAPAPSGDSGPWPAVRPGCGTVGGLFGDPAIRLAEFTRSWGTNGLLHSICENDYGPAMANIAEQLADRMAE